jgi:hypothetical protein
MARDQAQTPALHRVVSVAAVALLAGASAVAFGRVFAPTEVTWKLLGVALAAVAVAALLERRSLALATLASGAGLVLAVALVVFPDTTFAGLPTLATFRSILEALELVGHQARVEVAPTLPLQPLMLGAVTAVWTASFSAHALAVRSGSPFLAALPPAALLAFAGMVLEEGPRPGYALLFLVGLLAVLFADGLQRVRQWGPLRSWTGFSKRRRVITATTTRGARRVAVLALAVAAFLPGILPGYGAAAILDVDGATGSGLIAVNPLVSVASSLRRREEVELFTVEVNPPARTYWRLVALDRFDGDVWAPQDVSLDRGEPVEIDGVLPGAGPARGPSLTQTITISGLSSSAYLPVAFDPMQVAAEASLRFDPQSSALFSPDGLEDGFRYAVESSLPSPDPRALDAVTDLGDPAAGRYTQLPEDFPPEVHRIAVGITRGATTPFRKIVAIQDHLRSFQYDVSVEYGNRSDAMVRFLTQDRRGFCQQFAGTMAAMLRSLGIPARIAVGFTPGSPGSDGRIHVTSHDYHSWVEVPFPGYGWLSFEPTPGRTNPVALPYQSVPADFQLPVFCATRGCSGEEIRAREGAPGGASGAASGNRLRGIENINGIREGRFVPIPLPPTALAPAPEREGFPLRAVVLWGLVVLGALLALVPPVKLVTRRMAVRRARRQPRQLVLAAYGAFAGDAADVGLGRHPGETLWEHRFRLRREVRFSDGQIDRLTGITGRAAYSTRPVSGTLAREAVDAARVATRDIRRSVPVLRRVVGLYRIAR